LAARRATASMWWLSDASERSEAEVFRDQIGKLAQAIACTSDVNHDGVVQQAIQQGGSDNQVPKRSPHSAKPRFELRIIAPRSYPPARRRATAS